MKEINENRRNNKERNGISFTTILDFKRLQKVELMHIEAENTL